MYHFKCITQNKQRSAQIIVLLQALYCFDPREGHRTFWEASEGHRSQLLTLQHDLGRGAGEEDGAGLRCGES